MPRRLPSSALDQQTQITASSTGAILAGNWYIGTGGAGSGGAVAGTLTGPLVGNADTATAWKNKVVVNGTDLIGNVTPITIGVNTTSNPAAGTYYPLFVPSSSAGNQQASTSAASGFTFDPSTNNLVVAGTLSGSNLSGTHSGTNTGDETTATIKTKLGITTLSGSNTGDQDLSSYAPKASPNLTGTVSSQHISMNRDPEDSYRLSQRSRYADWEYWNNATTLKWDYYRCQMIGEITITRQFIRTGMSLNTTGDLTVAGKYYGDGSQLTGITSFDGNYNSLSNKPTIPSVSGTLKEVASWTSGYLGDGLQGYATGGGPVITGVVGPGGPLGAWQIIIAYEFDPSYFPGYNAADIVHTHVDYGYPVYWNGYEGGSVFTIANHYKSIGRRAGASGPVCAVGVTIACNQSRNVGADYWPNAITVHFYAKQ